MNVQIAYSIHLPTLFLLSNGDILAILLHARFHLRLQFYFLYHKYGNTGCGVFKGGFWLKINCSQMKLPNLEKWSGQKMPKFDFQIQFSMSKIIRIFLIFFH